MSSSVRSRYEDRNMQLTLAAENQGIFSIEVSGLISGTDFKPHLDPLSQVAGPEVYQGKVLLNLERANMVDSSGVGWMISTQRRFSDTGGLLVVHSIPPMVQSVLKLLRMDRVFNMADDHIAARARIAREES